MLEIIEMFVARTWLEIQANQLTGVIGFSMLMCL